MRKIVSVSLGSSRRDQAVTAEFAGTKFEISRVGTDGDIDRAVEMIRALDGTVDAIGLGGIDLYLWAGTRRYVIRRARALARAAVKTPVVDGSGMKNTLERRTVRYLADQGVRFRDQTVLIVCATDRFGLAEALSAAGAKLVLGDLMFALGLPVPLRSLRSLDLVARVVAPIACSLPLSWIYPIGKQQDRDPVPRWTRYYREADIIAGDLHFVRRYMPDDLTGKMVITNTVTRDNVEELRDRGVATLVSTTPELEGRSFGTNVMEAVLVSLAGKGPDELTESDYVRLLDEMGIVPRVERLGAAG